ncbi:hypothetical protein D3C85_966520 [compost metagenome]
MNKLRCDIELFLSIERHLPIWLDWPQLLRHHRLGHRERCSRLEGRRVEVVQGDLRQQLTRATPRLALVSWRVAAAHIRVHAGVDHFPRIGRVVPRLVADRVQREAQALLVAGDEMPAVLDPLREARGTRQRKVAIRPVHMPGGERQGMGTAYRGHGVHQAEKLDAQRYAQQVLRRFVRPFGRVEQLAQPGDEGARLRRPPGKAIDEQFDRHHGGQGLAHPCAQGLQQLPHRRAPAGPAQVRQRPAGGHFLQQRLGLGQLEPLLIVQGEHQGIGHPQQAPVDAVLAAIGKRHAQLTEIQLADFREGCTDAGNVVAEIAAIRLLQTGVVKPGDIGGVRRLGRAGVVLLVIVGAIEKQTDMQAMGAGGGTPSALGGIQPLAVGLLLGQLLAVIGAHRTGVAGQTPRQGKGRRHMG